MDGRKTPLSERVTTEKFYYYFAVTIMAAIPAGEFITELFRQPYVTQPLIVALYGCAGLFSVMCFFLGKSRSGKMELYGSDVFFILLVIFSVISLALSKDIMNSLMGYGYDEWIFNFLAYFSLMFAGTMINDMKLRKKVLYVFAAVALFNCLIAFFQSFGLRIADCCHMPEWHNQYNAAFGLTQNCNFFAGLCVLFSALSAGMFIFAENGRKKLLLLAFHMLCFYCTIASTTRISWLGNLGIHFFYAISFIVMKIKGYDRTKLRKYVRGWGAVLAVSVLVLAYFAVFTDVLSSGLKETLADISGDFDFEAFGSRRGYIWKFGLEAVPDNWVFGVGLDNYSYAFFSNPKWQRGMYYNDKGHNEYLHILVTQGVFAAVNYISMLVYACAAGVRTVVNTKDEEKRKLTWILLGMFAGYAAQALVNSSLINVAPYFWLTVGMTMPKSEQKVLRFKGKKHNTEKS